MRARNLKPAIFKNELLAVADPLYTVIFEGLWCLADREGRLEDRPAKIHFDINPGRAFETTEQSLSWLHENGFILRYQAGNVRYIQVITFKDHQNPHQKEPSSKIPAPSSEPDKPGASPVLASDRSGAGIGQDTGEHKSGPADSLFSDSGLRTPDSGLLIPDSCLPEASGNTHASVNGSAGDKPRRPNDADLTEAEHHARFERVMAKYPDFSGAPNLILVEKACRQLIDDGDETWDSIEAHADRFANFVTNGGRSGPQFVDNPLKFFSTQSLRRAPWEPPPTKADQRLAGNIDAVEQARRELFGSAS